MATTITVSNEAQLDAAISSANTTANQGAITIVVNGLLTENAAPTKIALASGNTLFIEGSGPGSGLDGVGKYRGLFVSSGNVQVDNLLLENDSAVGGAGTKGAGGGAGLGGGLLVGSAGVVTLSGVSFTGDSATGGAGGAGPVGGGNGGSGGFGGAGKYPASFGNGGDSGPHPGGTGGFGGGGGGGALGGTGGYGYNGGGAGGFGGGKGGTATAYSDAGSFSGGGGGGLGAGGDVFVQQGGTLLIEGGSLAAGTVNGGAGGSNASHPMQDVSGQPGTAGAAYGSAIFLQGNDAVTLAAASGQSLTVAGVIADQTGSGGGSANPGAGTLVVGIAAETGTVVLTGAETFTGAVLIQDGTLQLGNGGAGGSIGGTSGISDQATLVVYESGTVTLSAPISGAGSFTQEGSGTTVLTGANTFTGGVRIQTGTLQLGNSAAAGSFSATSGISNQATLAFGESGTLTLAAPISGAGSLLQEGSGTTVLTGTETFTGGVTIQAGTLELGTAASLNTTSGISDQATLAFGQSGTLALSAVISGTGGLLQEGGGTTVLTGADTFTGAVVFAQGTVQLGNGGTTGSINNASSISTQNGNSFFQTFLAVNESGIVTLTAPISGYVNVVQEGSGTTVLRATNSYSGGTVIKAGTLELDTQASAGSGAITFAGNGRLRLGFLDTNAASSGNTIDSFASGDTITIAPLTYNSSATAVLDSTTNKLTITAGATKETLQFDPSQSFAGEQFVLSSATAGTNLTLVQVACYAAGTHILTRRGEVAVEALAAGDAVWTVSGQYRPIVWIGRRSYAGRFFRNNRALHPILIRAGAIAEGVPRRDLSVSPKHALYIDGVLVAAELLVNGSSITQVSGLAAIEYVHIELETHDVILAEGAPAETFLDDDSRSIFHNAAEFHARYPDAAPAGPFCAPRVESGFAVEAIRQRLVGLSGRLERAA